MAAVVRNKNEWHDAAMMKREEADEERGTGGQREMCASVCVRGRKSLVCVWNLTVFSPSANWGALTQTHTHSCTPGKMGKIVARQPQMQGFCFRKLCQFAAIFFSLFCSLPPLSDSRGFSYSYVYVCSSCFIFYCSRRWSFFFVELWICLPEVFFYPHIADCALRTSPIAASALLRGVFVLCRPLRFPIAFGADTHTHKTKHTKRVCVRRCVCVCK